MPPAFALRAPWSSATVDIAYSEQEWIGVLHARPAIDLREAARNRRRAATSRAPDLPDAVRQVVQAFDALAAIEAKHGSKPGTSEGLQALAAKHRGLLDQPIRADSSQTFAQHTAFVSAIIGLLRDATDGSNLMLDPDLDTARMLDAALFPAPRRIEGIAQPRGMGNGILPARQTSVASTPRSPHWTMPSPTGWAGCMRHSGSRHDGALRLSRAVGLFNVA